MTDLQTRPCVQRPTRVNQGAKRMTTLKGELELQYDSYGIWLVEVGSNGTYQLGHIPWQTIAVYIKEYLVHE